MLPSFVSPLPFPRCHLPTHAGVVTGRFSSEAMCEAVLPRSARSEAAEDARFERGRQA